MKEKQVEITEILVDIKLKYQGRSLVFEEGAQVQTLPYAVLLGKLQ